MCLYCGTMCVFTRTLQLRMMTAREFDKRRAAQPGLFERIELERQRLNADNPRASKGSTQ